MSRREVAVAPIPAAVEAADGVDVPTTSRPAPVSSGAAALLLAAAAVVAALVSVSVARLVPFAEDEDALEAARPVPAEPASAEALVGVAPVITFDSAGPALPAEGLGPWSTEAGTWTVEGGVARASDPGDEGALAVVTAPAGAAIAQVTVRDPEPGTGLVVSYLGPDSYVALQVGRTGSTVQLVEVDGRRLQPRLLIVAEVASRGSPLVLAVRRQTGGYEAIANGVRIGHRNIEGDAPEPWRIGLVTGPRRTVTGTTFDDLVVR